MFLFNNSPKEKHKSIIIHSHSMPAAKALKTTCGDLYDSEIILKDEEGGIIDKYININVDDSVRTPHLLELSNGTYAGIVGMHKMQYPGIFLYDMKYIEKITDWRELLEPKNYKARTLPCIHPNPVHGGKKILQFVNIHKGGDEWDWSAGCITCHYSVYKSFIENFRVNEKVIIKKVCYDTALAKISGMELAL